MEQIISLFSRNIPSFHTIFNQKITNNMKIFLHLLIKTNIIYKIQSKYM